MPKKESHWFSHDATAMNDPKIIALITKYDFAGYGRWWRLLEILRGEEGYVYNITSKFAFSALANCLRLSVADTQAFIKDCLEEFELLQTDGCTIWSESLIRRMSYWDERKIQRSKAGKESAKKRWGKTADNEDKVTDPCHDDTDVTSKSQNGIRFAERQITNETKRNKTKLNETTCSDGQLLQLKEKLLDDENLAAVYQSWGVDAALLARWLDAWHRRLARDGTTDIDEANYRRNFGKWVQAQVKRYNTPEDYSPESDDEILVQRAKKK